MPAAMQNFGLCVQAVCTDRVQGWGLERGGRRDWVQAWGG